MSATGEPGDQVINDIAGSPMGILAVGSDCRQFEHDPAVWYSNDGSVWERLLHNANVIGGEGDQFMYSLIQTPDLAVVVGDSVGTGASCASRNGVGWERADANHESVATEAEPSVMNDVTIVDGTFVAVGSAGARRPPLADDPVQGAAAMDSADVREGAETVSAPSTSVQALTG